LAFEHSTGNAEISIESGIKPSKELSREAQQHANRSLSYCFADDGSLILKGRLPALAGATLIRAFDAAIETIPEKEISADMVEERAIPYFAQLGRPRTRAREARHRDRQRDRRDPLAWRAHGL
jgi:hypothetical protein